MIHVDRIKETPQIRDALLKPFPTKDNKTELELARDYYDATPPPEKAFSFARYKEHPVRLALDEMFHEKCAYCESSYKAVDSRDVEHFRPKGKVLEAPEGNKGYWWLAAKWSNLLPSCPPCNRKRRQLEYEPEMTIEEFDELRREAPTETSGKANSFPLNDDNWITTETQSVDDEDPLLINPCDREPNKHLEWEFTWDKTKPLWEADDIVPVILPKQTGQDDDDPYGKASVAVYGLNRSGLFRERKQRIQEIRTHCVTIVNRMRQLAIQGIPQQLKQDMQDELVHLHGTLQSFAKAEKPFSAMVTAFIHKFESELEQLGS